MSRYLVASIGAVVITVALVWAWGLTGARGATQSGASGDIDGDGWVNTDDLVLVRDSLGSRFDGPHWNPGLDLNADDQIDVMDLATAARNYGVIVPLPLQLLGIEPALTELQRRGIVLLIPPGDGTRRLFGVILTGEVLVFDSNEDSGTAKVYLDISDQVSTEQQEGLLSMAFDPDYADNGYFYVLYSSINPRRSVLSRFSLSAQDPSQADPTSEFVILEIPQPEAIHNAEHLAFGLDGFLYVAVGDGGVDRDPDGNAQNRTNLLGTILRLDVSQASPQEPYMIPPDNPFVGAGDGTREEIWAYGLRNPWRFDFDDSTGRLWVGDAGQARNEEVDLVERSRNYGWNIIEGTQCFPNQVTECDRTGLELPLLEYSHDEENCAIIGGFVYQGRRIPSLHGAYVYGDHCSGKVWGIRYDGATITEHLEIADTPLIIVSFGVDAQGELYLLGLLGAILRLVPLE